VGVLPPTFCIIPTTTTSFVGSIQNQVPTQRRSGDLKPSGGDTRHCAAKWRVEGPGRGSTLRDFHYLIRDMRRTGEIVG